MMEGLISEIQDTLNRQREEILSLIARNNTLECELKSLLDGIEEHPHGEWSVDKFALESAQKAIAEAPRG